MKKTLNICNNLCTRAAKEGISSKQARMKIMFCVILSLLISTETISLELGLPFSLN